MATKRRSITRNIVPSITDEELYFLSDGLLGEQPEKQSLKLFLLQADASSCKALWDENKDSILTAWIRERPGTRPSQWWDFDAPRITPESVLQLGRGIGWVTPRTSEFAEPRKRLGGIGTPNHEVLNYVPHFDCGIPDSWVSRWSADYYNGRKLDIHGNRIGADYEDGHFLGVPIDRNDPPKFENQAVYLRRHNLLEPGEERRLRPKDFEPEIIEFEEDAVPVSECSATVQ